MTFFPTTVICWRGIELPLVGPYCWASEDRRWVVTTYVGGPYLSRVQINMAIVIHASGQTAFDALDAAALELAQLGEQVASTLRQVK